MGTVTTVQRFNCTFLEWYARVVSCTVLPEPTRRTRTDIRYVFLLSLLILCLSQFAHAQSELDAETVNFNIPSQSLPSALSTFARQAKLELVFAEPDFDAVQTVAVVGRFRRERALELLLQGTGLRVGYGSGDSVIVQRAEPMETTGDAGIGNYANTRDLLAQANAQSNEPMADTGFSQTERNADSERPAEETKDAVLDEIVVTGTQIRGAGAAGADVITLDRSYIEQGGFATTQEVLQSIPQNFGLGANESAISGGLSGTNDLAWSSSVNLRGLGTEATLSLVNGRRTSPGGTVGGFVDLNFIPASAIERVEILADGASANYGSDAIGGVVNVILKKDYDAAETRVRYAPGISDIDEIQLNQVFAKSWESGTAMLSYEYYDRSELKSADRAYAHDSDLTAFGGVDSSTTFSNPGNIVGYTAADGTFVSTQLGIPGVQDGTALTPADLLPGTENVQNIREGSWVLPSQERHSAMLNFSQELSDTIELFTEIRYSKREFESRGVSSGTANRFTVLNTNPFFIDLDPSGGSTSLRVNYHFVDDYGQPRTLGDVESVGATFGAVFGLGESWELEAYASQSSEDTFSRFDRFPNTALFGLALADGDPATAFNVFGDGSSTNSATLAAIEGFTERDLESELMIFNVVADGELFELPGGAAKLAIGGEFRDQLFRSSFILFSQTPEPVISESGTSSSAFDLERDVAAAFAEFFLPLVSGQNEKPGIKRLEVSIAARYEEYSDFGDTLNPKFGVSWSPTDWLTVRSTYGTSFRAPLLTQLDVSLPRALTFVLPDPSSPTGVSRALIRFGNSASVQPEEGTSWTAGIDIRPDSLPGLSIGLTYFNTALDEKIATPFGRLTDPLLQPDVFAPVIARVPDNIDLGAVTTILADCTNCGTLTADDFDVVLDRRLTNIFKSEVSGLDLNAAYEFETSAGSFHAFVSASHLIGFDEQIFIGGPLQDGLDILAGPTSLKVRGGVGWNYGGLDAALIGNYITDYVSDRAPACNVETCPVGSWTTWDINAGYEFGESHSGLLGGSRFSINVRNVFDEDPPFVHLTSQGLGYDPVNANPFGMYVVFQATKAW